MVAADSASPPPGAQVSALRSACSAACGCSPGGCKAPPCPCAPTSTVCCCHCCGRRPSCCELPCSGPWAARPSSASAAALLPEHCSADVRTTQAASEMTGCASCTAAEAVSCHTGEREALGMLRHAPSLTRHAVPQPAATGLQQAMHGARLIPSPLPVGVRGILQHQHPTAEAGLPAQQPRVSTVRSEWHTRTEQPQPGRGMSAPETQHGGMLRPPQPA